MSKRDLSLDHLKMKFICELLDEAEMKMKETSKKFDEVVALARPEFAEKIATVVDLLARRQPNTFNPYAELTFEEAKFGLNLAVTFRTLMEVAMEEIREMH